MEWKRKWANGNGEMHGGQRKIFPEFENGESVEIFWKAANAIRRGKKNVCVYNVSANGLLCCCWCEMNARPRNECMDG